MPPPLIRGGEILITADGKLGAICLACEGAVRVIWVNNPPIDLQASISIPAGYFLWTDHYSGQWWWGIDFQAIYEDGLFDEDGEYRFTVSITNAPANSDLSIYFSNGENDDSKQVVPAASKAVTVRLDGTITLS